MKNKFTLGIIGAGNMASAIVGGILNNKLLSPKDIIISDLDIDKLSAFKDKGIATTSNNASIVTNCTNLLFAVKPQIAPIVMQEISSIISAETVISIMAGISIAKIKTYLGDRNYARIMPNTPSLVGKGMAAVTFSEDFYSVFIMDIFKSLGKVIEIDENLFDAVTSLSGSGPAYVYMFVKALIDGGIEGGLDADTAKILALQTVVGSVEMIAQSNEPIDHLINAVCSKGGTTIQAIDSFRENKLEEIVSSAMEKCRNRSKELGK